MEPLYFEILHTAQGSAAAADIRALIDQDPLLKAASKPWTRPGALPANVDLYALIVVVSDDVGADPQICARVASVAARGFPVLPVVPCVANYNFSAAPIPALSAQNAAGLDTPTQIVDALRHHGGLRRHGSGGQVFISYARRDGSELAQCLREQLQQAGFRAFLDTREVPGGSQIQANIRDEISRSDLILLIDSRGAADSQWVHDELDMARVAHVPVIAVTPSADAFEHNFRTPHAAWSAGDDIHKVAAEVVHKARQMLARKVTFRDRVARAMKQVSELRGWQLLADREHWQVRLKSGDLSVECCAEEPSNEAVIAFHDRLGERRGALVAGTRPFLRNTARGFARVGGDKVRVTPLSRVASTVSGRLAARPLAGQRIFLSAALPDRAEADFASYTLAPFVVTFIQTMFDLGATIVFGGHPTVLPLIHKAVIELVDADSGSVELFQATTWRHHAELAPEVRDARVFRQISWHGDGSSVPGDLAAMRSAMITAALHGAVFVGGKLKEFQGDQPGIVDEYRRFRAACPTRPAFLLGLAGGATAELLRNNEPPGEVLAPRLTDELRRTHDPDLATALIVSELLSRDGQAI